MTRITLIASMVLGLSAAVAAQPAGVEISDAWARATTSTARVGGVFMTLMTKGSADRVMSASSPVAEKVEIHETLRDGDVMKMREVGQLDLQPGKVTVLKPGAHHIMLIGLKKKLSQGESFPLTLTFERAPPVTVTVVVQSAGAAGSGHRH